MKKIFFIIIGILISAVFLELICQIIRPEILLDKVVEHEDCKLDLSDSFTKKFFQYLYTDIYDDYFLLNENLYITKRVSPFTPDSNRDKIFKKEKEAGIKRIFIAGESVAEYYPKEVLLNNLNIFLPLEKFEIINAGTGSYESLRINRIVKEITKYQPDYIIVLVGNNDGIFHPVEINYLPYKYALFHKSYILNRLSNYVVCRKDFNFSNIEPFFEENIIKMVKNTKNKCPIIFVTLPHNLLWNDNSFYCNFPSINEKKDLEKEGIYINRRDFLRSLPKKYNWVYIVDFDKKLKEYVYPGYNVFSDNDHYYGTFYDIISKMFVETIFKISANIDKQYFEKMVDCGMDEIPSSICNKDDYHNYGKILKMLRELYFHDKLKFKNSLNMFFEKKSYLSVIASIHILILYDNNEQLVSQCFNRYIETYPYQYEIYLLKALAYCKNGNILSAEKNFNIAVNLNNDNKIVLKDLENCFKE